MHWNSELEGVQTRVSWLDMKPLRRLYDGGFMVVLHDMNPNDHSQILPISHMKVYLIILCRPFMIRPKSLCKTFKPWLSLTIWKTGVKCWQLLKKTHVFKDSDQILWSDVVVISFYHFMVKLKNLPKRHLNWDRQKVLLSRYDFGSKSISGSNLTLFGVGGWTAGFKHIMPPLPHVIVSAIRYNV